MKKLYALLSEGFVKDWLVTPLAVDIAGQYIKDSRIEQPFLSMMGSMGQVQFHQRFTIKTLQLIRVLNNFFDMQYNKAPWRDTFTSDPDERYRQGFNRYSSLTAVNVLQIISREKSYSQMYQFIDCFKAGVPIAEMATRHFRSLWEHFPDLVKPYLPSIGAPESHIARFLENDEISEIPEFHIMSTLLHTMIDAYGIEHLEHGLKDEELLAAECAAAYIPYCHYYVTKVDIAEIITMSDIQDTYSVRVYDHNESSLYRLIQDITEDYKSSQVREEYLAKRSIFQKGGTKL